MFIDLRKSIHNEEMSENENPKKVVDIAEKILDINKQQKCKEIKILTPKQKLQRLPIALAQVKQVVHPKHDKWIHTNHIFFVLRKRSY